MYLWSLVIGGVSFLVHLLLGASCLLGLKVTDVMAHSILGIFLTLLVTNLPLLGL